MLTCAQKQGGSLNKETIEVKFLTSKITKMTHVSPLAELGSLL